MPSLSAVSSHDLDLIRDVRARFLQLATVRRDIHGQLSALLSELNELARALEQHWLISSSIGRSSPPLGAVDDILRQCLDCAERSAWAPSFSVDTVDVRRDSGTAERSSWCSADFEFAALRQKLIQVTLLLKRLNFSKLLRAGYADTDRSSVRASVHGSSAGFGTCAADDRELFNLLRRLARLWNAVYRGSNARCPPSPRQLESLEDEKERLIHRLAAFAGLAHHPIADCILAKLDDTCNLDYLKSMDDIRSLSVRRQDDSLLAAHRATIQACRVTIDMKNVSHGHAPTKAAKFQMLNDRCCWFDDQGELVLEHTFSRPVGDRFPWRSSVLHTAKSPVVAFTKYQAHGSAVRCLDHNHPTHLNKAPDYIFELEDENDDSYKRFQSAMCNAEFYAEYELSSIKWGKPKASKHIHVKPQEEKDVFLKVWKSYGHQSVTTITIPVKYDNEVRHWEVPLKWLQPTKASHGLKFMLKQRPRSPIPSQNSDSSTPPTPRRSSILRPITWGSGFSSRLSPSPPNTSGNPIPQDEDIAPHSFTERFEYFHFQFAQPADQDKFLKLFDEARTRISRNPPSDFDLGSPRIPPSESPPPESPSKSSHNTPSETHSGEVGTAPFFDPTRPISSVERGPLDLGPPALQPDDFRRRGGPKLPFRGTVTNGDHGDVKNFYQPLAQDGSEIRILRIEKGDYGDLDCSLQPFSFDNLPDYEAMSYCWGQGESTRIIPAGDLQGFRVSEHLWHALLRLRDPKRSRLIWTDKLCIDQANVKEKNQQIALMQEIYHRAVRTIIWIGETDPAKESCPRIYCNHGDEEPTLSTEPEASSFGELESESLRRAIRDMRKDVECGEVWWKRLWCVQEFNFSSRRPAVYLGPHVLHWEHFCELFDDGDDSLSLFKQLRDENSKATPTSHSLFSMLSMTGRFECSDPRDRVFALLGMTESSQSRAADVPVDYRSSLIRVWEDASRSLILSEGTLDVLLDERLSRSSLGAPGAQLPSWIPDFRCMQKLEVSKVADKYRAGPGTPDFELVHGSSVYGSPHSILDQPRELRLKAIKFDKIETRTRKADIGPYERSRLLVYNSLKTRGHIIERILDTLAYDFKKHKENAQSKNLEPSPGLGRLMLDYLYEGKHSINDEFVRRRKEPPYNPDHRFEFQRKQDLRYVQDHMKSLDDAEYVNDRWDHKEYRAGRQEKYTPDRLKSALSEPDVDLRTTIDRDFKVARDVENLFAFARQEESRYYLTLESSEDANTAINFDAPMRNDTLTADSIDKVFTSTFYTPTQAKKIEFHDYHEKRRERDFFKTSTGFVGLGPSTMETGDDVIIPQGSSWPWVVRTVGSHYVLIGECVIPNIMRDKYFLNAERLVERYRIR